AMLVKPVGFCAILMLDSRQPRDTLPTRLLFDLREIAEPSFEWRLVKVARFNIAALSNRSFSHEMASPACVARRLSRGIVGASDCSASPPSIIETTSAN